MSNIRRPGASIDTLRLGRAVSFPGIDPRLWCSLAIVSAVNVDADHGPFVDVTLLPSGMTATARVGAEMAGGGFGVWAPILVDDEVVVVAPDGAPANGLVVVRRLWSASDKPPDDAVQHPGDVLIQAKDGTKLRLRTSGSASQMLASGPDLLLQATPGTTIELKDAGTVTVNADGSITLTAPLIHLVGDVGSEVKLGKDAAERVILTEEFLNALGDLITAIANSFGNLTATAGGTLIGTSAQTTVNNSLIAFQNLANTYKSQIVKVR